MQKYLCLFVLFITSFIRCNSVDELEQMIKDSDLKGVKRIFAILGVDQSTKVRLFEFANDIVTMRLKSMEIWQATGSKLADVPEDFRVALKKEESQQELNKSKWQKLAYKCCIGLICVACGQMLALVYASLDNMHISKTTFKYYAVALVLNCYVGLFGVMRLDQTMHDQYAKKARDRFRLLYSNAIEIKQLISRLTVKDS